MGRKVSDEWTVPLCVIHHHAVHSVGDEKQWWTDKGVDPIAHALRLWWDTRHGGVDHQIKNAPASYDTVIGKNYAPPMVE